MVGERGRMNALSLSYHTVTDNYRQSFQVRTGK